MIVWKSVCIFFAELVGRDWREKEFFARDSVLIGGSYRGSGPVCRGRGTVEIGDRFDGWHRPP
jgi:hypothetical protein